ncbi:MAG: hypothetical protein K2Z81_28720, partial [Cyanobacteria bacterium]|nr:hypothetical protein [Cyanobacteriota bacterium]
LRGTKAVGEPPLVLAISVWTAIKHALSFVCGKELPCLSVPATNEEILGRLTYYESLIVGKENCKVSSSGWIGDGNGDHHFTSDTGITIPTIKHGYLRPVSDSVARAYSGTLVKEAKVEAEEARA